MSEYTINHFEKSRPTPIAPKFKTCGASLALAMQLLTRRSPELGNLTIKSVYSKWVEFF